MLDALVVAPHPDDAEIGMGGTIVRLLSQGWTLGILDLTSGEPTPLGSPGAPRGRDRRGQRGAGRPVAAEPRPAQPQPGADPAPSPRPGRRLPRGPAPPPVRAVLGGRPPRPHAATKLVEDARFWSKLSKSDIPGAPFHPARILYYFSVHLRIVERPSFLVDVSAQLEAKVAALRCYRSQFLDNLPAEAPGVLDSVCDRTRFWGHTIGVRHAEPFASREPIGLTGLDHLLL
jgi:LmbE family N-acetylglucosaminyl deacetylase